MTTDIRDIKIPCRGYKATDGGVARVNGTQIYQLDTYYPISEYIDMNGKTINIPNPTGGFYNFVIGTPLYPTQKIYYNSFNPTIPLLIVDNNDKLVEINSSGWMDLKIVYVAYVPHLPQ